MSGLALIAKIGTMTIAIPIGFVVETMRPLPIEALDRVEGHVRGVAIIRGVPTVVIDTAALLGAVRGATTRLVVVRTGDRKAALMVDAVEGIRSLGTLGALPPLVAAPTLAAIGAIDRELVVMLETARLVPETA
jgi:purine-binding chemotaxis protein CheW